METFAVAVECPLDKIGDAFCNDDANTAQCDYDNGDCCLYNIQDVFCDTCICHLDNTRHPSVEGFGKTSFMQLNKHLIDRKC